MNSPSTDRSLPWLLRFVGGIELCAIPFVLFPMSWMAEVHASLLGLGPMPQAPIVDYLTRSLSMLYAVHGAVVFRLSFDVVRYRSLVGFLGWLHAVLGVAILAIDLSAGLPWWWVMGEGPGIAAGGALVLLLNREAVTDSQETNGTGIPGEPAT